MVYVTEGKMIRASYIVELVDEIPVFPNEAGEPYDEKIDQRQAQKCSVRSPGIMIYTGVIPQYSYWPMLSRGTGALRVSYCQRLVNRPEIVLDIGSESRTIRRWAV